jgi:hypothetical protein
MKTRAWIEQTSASSFTVRFKASTSKWWCCLLLRAAGLLPTASGKTPFVLKLQYAKYPDALPAPRTIRLLRR